MPIELSKAEQIELLRDFVKREFVSRGMVALLVPNKAALAACRDAAAKAKKEQRCTIIVLGP